MDSFPWADLLARFVLIGGVLLVLRLRPWRWVQRYLEWGGRG